MVVREQNPLTAFAREPTPSASYPFDWDLERTDEVEIYVGITYLNRFEQTQIDSDLDLYEVRAANTVFDTGGEIYVPDQGAFDTVLRDYLTDKFPAVDWTMAEFEQLIVQRTVGYSQEVSFPLNYSAASSEAAVDRLAWQTQQLNSRLADLQLGESNPPVEILKDQIPKAASDNEGDFIASSLTDDGSVLTGTSPDNVLTGNLQVDGITNCQEVKATVLSGYTNDLSAYLLSLFFEPGAFIESSSLRVYPVWDVNEAEEDAVFKLQKGANTDPNHWDLVLGSASQKFTGTENVIPKFSGETIVDSSMEEISPGTVQLKAPAGAQYANMRFTLDNTYADLSVKTTLAASQVSLEIDDDIFLGSPTDVVLGLGKTGTRYSITPVTFGDYVAGAENTLPKYAASSGLTESGVSEPSAGLVRIDSGSNDDSFIEFRTPVADTRFTVSANIPSSQVVTRITDTLFDTGSNIFLSVQRAEPGSYLMQPVELPQPEVVNPQNNAFTISDGTPVTIQATPIAGVLEATATANQGVRVSGDLRLDSDVSEKYPPVVKFNYGNAEMYDLGVRKVSNKSYQTFFNIGGAVDGDLAKIKVVQPDVFEIISAEDPNAGNLLARDTTPGEGGLSIFEGYSGVEERVIDASAAGVTSSGVLNLVQFTSYISVGSEVNVVSSLPSEPTVTIDLTLSGATDLLLSQDISVSFLVPELDPGQISRFKLFISATGSGIFNITWQPYMKWSDGIEYQPRMFSGTWDYLKGVVDSDGYVSLDVVQDNGDFNQGSLFNVTPLETQEGETPYYQGDNSLVGDTGVFIENGGIMRDFAFSDITLGISSSDTLFQSYNPNIVIDAGAAHTFIIEVAGDLSITLDITNLSPAEDQVTSIEVWLVHDNTSNPYVVSWDATISWARGASLQVPAVADKAVVAALDYVGSHQFFAPQHRWTGIGLYTELTGG